MHDKIVALILQQAARAEGSTQALATRLHAPEATLLRWMDGRAQTPLRAFLAVLDFLMDLERKSAETLGPTRPGHAVGNAPQNKLVFPLGALLARCGRCDGTEFRLLAEEPLRLTSVLACTACGEQVVHGNLLAQLAKDAVHQSKAIAVRTRRAVSRGRALVESGKRRLEASARRIPVVPPDDAE
ncbi:MAG TPA: hypothetical protein VFI86_06390 [Burkholderiales bacterium]|nr:hypothetical protein [Burkholderiales bacterium]